MSMDVPAPLFQRMIDLITKDNPLQRKSIDRFVHSQDLSYFAQAEEIIRSLSHSFLVDEQCWNEAAAAYNQLCADYVWSAVRFQETGAYPSATAADTRVDVYSQPEVMRPYMIGLMLSYLLWPNHVAILNFYRNQLRLQKPKSYCEVGIGHGLFVVEQMRAWPGVPLTLVDISETSIKLAKEILQTFGLDPNEPRYVQGDFLVLDLPPDSFDLLVTGEVLEHVYNAPAFLARAQRLLSPDGRMFLTTCANCPATDHLYHFHNIYEIRNMVSKAGLTVARELKLPAHEIPEESWESSRVTINYASWLIRQ